VDCSRLVGVFLVNWLVVAPTLRVKHDRLVGAREAITKRLTSTRTQVASKQPNLRYKSCLPLAPGGLQLTLVLYILEIIKFV
jgi:hypothetical protein